MKLTIAIGALAALALAGGTAGDPAAAVSPQGMTQEQLPAPLSPSGSACWRGSGASG